MNVGNGAAAGITSEVNVTPMIDVLLVLLIIFMVIVPALPKGEAALAPKDSLSDSASNDAIVLEITKGLRGEVGFRINQQTVLRQDLPARLESIYANRAQRVLYLKGDDQLSFTQVAEVIDISHSAGVDRIGLMTPRVLAGQ
jgi:biopolymer transport protein ExbD